MKSSNKNSFNPMILLETRLYRQPVFKLIDGRKISLNPKTLKNN